MELSVAQEDALTELINIGYGRAAGALSELTGYRVTLEVPKVALYAISQLPPILISVLDGEVASVNQAFSGPISGNALLMLDEKSAMHLSHLLMEGGQGETFDVGAREIVTEVGNILLNACLGVFGNLLQVHVSFDVPRMHVEPVGQVMKAIELASPDVLTHALMVHTRFQVRASNVSGYLVIILGIASLDRLLEELIKWEKRQTN